MERKLLDMMNQLSISEYNPRMKYCDKFQFIKLNNTYITETDRSSVSVIFMPFSVLQVHLRSGKGLYISLFHFQTVRCPLSDAGKRRNLLWNFSTVQSRYFRLSSSHSVLVSASGARSICWRATATITPVPMLMYGKEASNRKQEIDRQHYTIPNQRPKDKHCGKI